MSKQDKLNDFEMKIKKSLSSSTKFILLTLLTFAFLQISFIITFHKIFIESESVEIMNRANYLVNKVPLSPIWEGRSWIVSIFFSMPLFIFSLFTGISQGWGIVLIFRLFSSLISILSIYFSFLLGKRLKNERVGLYVAFFVAFSSVNLLYSFFPRDFNLALFSIIIGTYLLLSDTYKNQILSGVFFGLAFTSRYESIILVMLVLLYRLTIFLKDRNSYNLKYFLSLLTGFLLVSIIFQGVIDKIFWGDFLVSPISYFKYNFSTKPHLTTKKSSLIFYLNNQINILNFCTLPFILGLIIVYNEKGPYKLFLITLLLFLIFYVLFFSVIIRETIRYLQIILPFVSIFTALGLDKISSFNNRVVFILLFVFLLFNLHNSLINFKEHEEFDEIDIRRDKMNAIEYLEDKVKSNTLEKKKVYLWDYWLTGYGLINHTLNYYRLGTDPFVRIIASNGEETLIGIDQGDKWINLTSEIDMTYDYRNIYTISLCGYMIVDKVWIETKDETTWYDFGEDLSEGIKNITHGAAVCSVENEGVEIIYPNNCIIIPVNNEKMLFKVRVYAAETFAECMCNKPYEPSYLIIESTKSCSKGKTIKNFGNIVIYSLYPREHNHSI